MAVWWACGFYSLKEEEEEKKTRTESPGLPVLGCSQISLHRVFFKSSHWQPTREQQHGPSRLICSPAEAVGDMNICYVLDGILVLYGIILTVLYCRLRMTPTKKKRANPPEKKPAVGGIYAVRPFILKIKKTFNKAHDGKVTAMAQTMGLTKQSGDVYETIKMDKKTIV